MIKGSPTREVYFDNAWIPGDRLIGEEAYAMKTLDHTRVTAAAQAEAARQMTYAAASRSERGDADITFFGAAAKCFASDVGLVVPRPVLGRLERGATAGAVGALMPLPGPETTGRELARFPGVQTNVSVAPAGSSAVKDCPFSTTDSVWALLS